MIAPSNRSCAPSADLLLPAILAALFVALLFRSAGLYPVVLADEQIYSAAARLTSPADSPIPNYLFLALFSTTTYCGSEFLACARILNSLLFVGAIPFVYLVARKVTSRKIASGLATLIAISPLNTYTAYFMPESFYFFGFWAFTWFLLTIEGNGTLRTWALVGIILGLTTLIKPHALFMFPAVALYVLLISEKGNPKDIAMAVSRSALVVICALGIKFVIGALIAEGRGVTLFGPLYGGIASNSTRNLSRLLEILLGASPIALGHILAAVLLYGVPIAILLYTLAWQRDGQRGPKASGRIALFTALVLANLIVVTALFTASVAGSNSTESATRLHMRYYNFALPLLPILAVSYLSSERASWAPWKKMLIGLPLIGIGLFAAFTQLYPFTPSFVDSPELRGLTASPVLFMGFALSSVFLVALWIYSERWSSRLFFYAWFPIGVVLSSYVVGADQSAYLAANAYDRAGIVARALLSSQERSRTLILGPEPTGLFRTLFHLDSAGARFQVISPDSPIDMDLLSKHRDWLLVFGDPPLALAANEPFMIGGARLVRLARERKLDFSKAQWFGVVVHTRGLSDPEPWGTWSIGPEVAIEFADPLPSRFKVRLTASAFGPNVQEPFHLKVGSSSVQLTLGGKSSSQEFVLDNPTGAKVLNISVPAPTSPSQLGLSADDRKIGLGLQMLEIEPLTHLQPDTEHVLSD